MAAAPDSTARDARREMLRQLRESVAVAVLRRHVGARMVPTPRPRLEPGEALGGYVRRLRRLAATAPAGPARSAPQPEQETHEQPLVAAYRWVRTPEGLRMVWELRPR